MNVQNNLRIIMAKKRIDSLSDLINKTGLSRKILNKLWHNEDLESVKLGTLLVICERLEIPLSDLIHFEPSREKQTPFS